MASELDRRTFLKVLGASSALVPSVALAPSAAAQTAVHPVARWGQQKVTEIPSLCELCFWRCGIVGKVRDGRLLRVDGNPEHPRSRGRLCARGNAGAHFVYDPDRLKYPLRRVGERGEGKWKRITWDEALDLWAERLQKTIADHGPGAIGLFSHGLHSRFLNSLLSHLGSPNRVIPSVAQCRGPRDMGFECTFGVGPGSPARHDMARSKMIVLFGCHIGENVQTAQVGELIEGLDAGARLVVVDPRFSVAASKARRWMQIRPGTDMALLLAWIHVLLAKNWHDKEYVHNYCSGIDELRKAMAPYTPQWASEVTQIPEDDIVVEAFEMRNRLPSVLIHCGRFAAWHGNDTQRARAMAILTALLGAWGRPGGYYLPSDIRVGPKACPKPKKTEGSVASGNHALSIGVASHELVEASIGDEAPVKQWVLYNSNVLESIPGRARTLEALRSLDFVVMVDIMPTEPALWADLILPEATYLERYDDLYYVKDHPVPFVALRQPVIPARFESKSGYWIARQLAQRLELEDCFLPPDEPSFLKARLAPTGVSLTELSTRGVKLLDEQMPYLDSAVPYRFPTPSGKIELHSTLLEKSGYDPIPRFEALEQPPEGYLRLVAGRSPLHSFCRTGNISRLTHQQPDNQVWINAELALANELASGDEVVLENEDGVRSTPVRVLATPAIRPDVAYMVHGFGGSSPALRHAFQRTCSDNVLTTRFAIDPPTGATGLRVNHIRLLTPDHRPLDKTTEKYQEALTPIVLPGPATPLPPEPEYVPPAGGDAPAAAPSPAGPAVSRDREGETC